MDYAHSLALALDPSLILRAQGLDPDPWQRQFLLCADRQVLLNCCRQSGKSTATAARALHTALFSPGSLVLLLSPTYRQSSELFRKVRDAYDALGRPVPPVSDARSQATLELANGSRVIGLPGKEDTIRGFSRAALLLIDEAAKVHDDLYRSVRPMLAVSRGQIVCLSTPFGQRGFFFREWHSENPWRRFRITWQDCPRIAPDFIDIETALDGQIVGRSGVQLHVHRSGRCGLSGFRVVRHRRLAARRPRGGEVRRRHRLGLPQSLRRGVGLSRCRRRAVAGLGALCERDAPERPYQGHARVARARCGLSRSGSRDVVRRSQRRREIDECRMAGWKILGGFNDIRLGIAAVTARLQTRRLRVSRWGCTNLVEEAQKYRYPAPHECVRIGENPKDEHNHALGALRYLIAKLDHTIIARLKKAPRHGE